MERCTITMKVDTKKINPGNVTACIKFEDSFGGEQSGSPEDFTSKISIGDEICWEAEAKDRQTGDTVTIDKITYEAHTNILGQTELHGDACGKVTGNALHGQAGDEQEYGVYFTVTSGSQPPVQFYVDPKLKIRNTHSS